MHKLIVVGAVVAVIGCGGGGSNNGAGGTGGSPAGAAGTTGTAGTTATAGTTGAGGSSGCIIGTEGCACYANDTCNGNLRCLSRLCVSLPGTAGTTGAAGTTAAAGTTGAAGTTAAAGTTGAAGTTAAAGTTGAAGTTAAAGTTGAAGTTAAAGTTGAAGTTAAAGTTGAAGTTAAAGTTGTGGRGGMPSSGALPFTGGVVQQGSNTWGVSGGIYTFADAAGSSILPNCTTDSCFSNLTSTGPICVSGIGARVLTGASGTPDYGTYWGAALALDLNNPTFAANAQLAYRASDYGVKGFQFTFQNRASSTVRMTFKVRDPSSGQLADYCLDVATATSTIHFSDAKLQCYLNPPGPALTAALADHLEALQWQVPTNTTAAVGFDYCISNITPLTQ